MMKTKLRRSFLLTVLALFASVSSLQAQASLKWFVDFEAGSVFPGYCDVRIPGTTGALQNSNLGFVPLLNFLLEWRFSPVLRLLLEGDAAAAPQGRAEDVQFALVYQKSENWSIRLGYRILEGGADNDKVYNFALFNYLLAGVTGHF